MKDFHEFVAIDWSGALTPLRTPSIAVALAPAGQEPPHLSGKLWSRSMVADWIVSLAQRSNKRTLIGIDCNFGYSEQVGMLQFGADYTGFDLWAAVEEANVSHENYYAGEFWSPLRHGRHFWVSGKMPPGFLMPRRLTETFCGEAGLGWPESPFKLIGAKQVGKGGLAGMRMAYDLKRRLGDKIAFWPFDGQGAEASFNDARIVVTEIYPRLFLRLCGHGNAKIRTAEGLNAALTALGSLPSEDTRTVSDHSADALVSAAGLRLLCGRDKTMPGALWSPPGPQRQIGREGWIFGVGAVAKP